ncbi:MAG: hypothetical protein GY847_22805 [Proteobacteria bacterium]|nr:hypothetical protein [Pseudomonadota bacterium]
MTKSQIMLASLLTSGLILLMGQDPSGVLCAKRTLSVEGSTIRLREVDSRFGWVQRKWSCEAHYEDLGNSSEQCPTSLPQFPNGVIPLEQKIEDYSPKNKKNRKDSIAGTIVSIRPLNTKMIHSAQIAHEKLFSTQLISTSPERGPPVTRS